MARDIGSLRDREHKNMHKKKEKKEKITRV
jgi:hypothetical protein